MRMALCSSGALALCLQDSFFGGTLLATGHEDGSVQFWSLGLLSLWLKETQKKKTQKGT